MKALQDHPARFALANELHARPFPQLNAPAQAAFLAIKSADGVHRDRALDDAHLVALLDRFGAAHPRAGATHYSGDLGRYTLKWESHTEFVTYTVFSHDGAEDAFLSDSFGAFPEDWLGQAPGFCLTSALVRIDLVEDEARVTDNLNQWFVAESLAVSRVLEDDAIVASDFRIDPQGHVRMAVFARPETGPARIGRVVQRLCEIETYKAMAMLGLIRSRKMTEEMNRLDTKLSEVTCDMTGQSVAADVTLAGLLEVSARLEDLASKSAFRLSATQAYEAIVSQRISVLHEQKYKGRQTLAEFMMRRFDPAMRTVIATERRLGAMSARALRAGELLRTRVEVERSAQNQALLASMDKRSDLQLRLQHTVEGLSVVAISYYAVNILGYTLTPWIDRIGVSKAVLYGVLAPVVMAVVFGLLKFFRKRLMHKD